MRVTSSITALTWIPSEAITGMPSVPVALGVAGYDEPPPEVVDDVDALRERDGFRYANVLGGWIDVEGGRIVDHGQEGRTAAGGARLTLPPKRIGFPAVELPVIRPEPEVGQSWVRFRQTAGGRLGFPAPRRVPGRRYVRVAPAVAWTTLELILYADGRKAGSLVGASPFPRHWIYDESGRLVEKTGTIDFDRWHRESYGDQTPWGGDDEQPLLSEVETQLERTLSDELMRNDRPLRRRTLEPGELLVEQGDPGDDLFLLLDGVIEVIADGEVVAQVGPGAIAGERGVLEERGRTATLRAVTPCRLAVFAWDEIHPYKLAELAFTHHREEPE